MNAATVALIVSRAKQNQIWEFLCQEREQRSGILSSTITLTKSASTNHSRGLSEVAEPTVEENKEVGVGASLNPRLQWAGKAERNSFGGSTVSLYVTNGLVMRDIMHGIHAI